MKKKELKRMNRPREGEPKENNKQVNKKGKGGKVKCSMKAKKTKQHNGKQKDRIQMGS